MSSHIPAWKRLGLKLKHASEASPGGIISNQTPVDLRESETAERPSKRQKVGKVSTSADVEDSGIRGTKGDFRELVPSSYQQEKDLQWVKSEARPVERKKSVSFADDTKLDDGDTRVTIDFPSGSPGSTPKKPLSLRGTESSLVEASPSQESTRDTQDSESKPRSKKSKKSKTTRRQPDLKDKAPPALDYLRQHRENRAEWKFNKNRDIWILSHALDTTAIPESHVLSLAGYVRGLPQNAGARRRLLAQAREALAEEPMLEAGIRTRYRDVFSNLLENSSGTETTGLADMKLCSRPLLLLWALNENVDSSSMAMSKDLSNGNADQLNKGKRKSRTSAPVDISSSESESDSETETSDSSEGGMPGPQSTLDDSTSSQSSSESDPGETSTDEDSSSSE